MFERVTINQVKKGDAPRIDAKQLFLLSRFPVFRLPKRWGGKVYALPNYSHCLGSHSLLSNEFTFISSVLLDYARPSRFNGARLKKWFDDEDFLFPRMISHKSFVCRPPISPPAPMDQNFGCAWDTKSFADRYLRSGIGEVVWGNPRSPNPQAWKLIQDIVDNMALLDGERGTELIEKFHEYPYEGQIPDEKQIAPEDDDGGSIDNDKGEREKSGGFGIIYTEVNLDDRTYAVIN